MRVFVAKPDMGYDGVFGIVYDNYSFCGINANGQWDHKVADRADYATKSQIKDIEQALDEQANVVPAPPLIRWVMQFDTVI